MTHRLNPFLTFGCALAGLILFAAGSTLAGRSAAAQTPVMRVDPPTKAVDVGSGSFTVNILIDNVTNLGAFDVELTFDPDILRLVSAVDAGFLGSTGRQANCPSAFMTTNKKPADTLRFGCATTATSSTLPGPNGSGVLATITFAPKAGGSSPLSLGAQTGWGSPLIAGTEAFPVVTQDGQVTVTGAGPAATPRPDEPTPIPTRHDIPVVNPTPTPNTDLMFTPEPGETPMARPMPGRGMSGPSADNVAGANAAAAGSSASSGTSSGSPKAGTGPEQRTSRWPVVTGLILMASGVLFLSFAAYTRRGRGRIAG